jgi:hypothetical protein
MRSLASAIRWRNLSHRERVIRIATTADPSVIPSEAAESPMRAEACS